MQDDVQPNYKTLNYTIPAGGEVQFARSANFITCLEANAAFRLRIGDAPVTDFEAGLTLRAPSRFYKVQVINPTASELRVTLGLGKGDIRDARSQISTTLSVSPEAAPVFSTGAAISAADAATTALVAANTERAELMLVNDGAGRVLIGGDSGAAAGEGIPLEPGGTLVLTTSAAIYARNDSGAAVPVFVAELARA